MAKQASEYDSRNSSAMKIGRPRNYAQASGIELVKRFYREQGETVKVRQLAGMGLRHKDGRIYNILADSLEAGMTIVRWCRVKRNGEAFLCAYDHHMGVQVDDDRLTELVEWNKVEVRGTIPARFNVTKFWRAP